jgi:hypothetical protein
MSVPSESAAKVSELIAQTKDLAPAAHTPNSEPVVGILKNNGETPQKNVLLPELSAFRESSLLRSSSDGVTSQGLIPITKDASARRPFFAGRPEFCRELKSKACQTAAKKCWRRSR